MKRLLIERSTGTVMVSSDLHGNLDDFRRLRNLFESAISRGLDWTWVGLGDWIHGPVPRKRTQWAGEDLFNYPDESPQIVREVVELRSRHPERFFSLLGNHEHAHIGGRLTAKYHANEAEFLESQLSCTEVESMKREFSCWPLVAQFPSCGVVLTHGAPPDDFSGPHVVDQVSYDWHCPPESSYFLENILWNYGFEASRGRNFLDQLAVEGFPYGLIVHGHDKEIEGGCPDGPHAFLLCSSFGAKRARKAYLTLDLGRYYGGPAELRDDRDLYRLYDGSPPFDPVVAGA